MTIFNPKESAVLTTSIFNMTDKKARAWIEKNHGYKLTRNQYNYVLAQIDANVEKRRRKFVLEGVFKKQIEAIDRLDNLIALSHTNGEACVGAGKFRDAQFVYNSIARLQEILTSYYDEIQDIIEYDNDKQKEDPQQYSTETQTEQNVIAFTTEYSGPGNRPTTYN